MGGDFLSLQGGYLDFPPKESQGEDGPPVFFLRCDMHEMFQHFFFTNKQMDHHPMGWRWWKNLGGSRRQLKTTKLLTFSPTPQRRPCEAEAELRATWQSLQRVMGSRHPLSLTTLQILGVG